MIDQIGILGFGLGALFLTNVRDTLWRRWAPVCGLLAEPFWFYTGIVNHQWGIIALSFVYMGGWGMGFYNAWIRKGA